ncbi:hypothetical protein HanLR1_Chr10g0366501 [Helianthus annuus]|nr:hypothetical protein HanLR1_Chr10g0366501 [Helianthus annuus]
MVRSQRNTWNRKKSSKCERGRVMQQRSTCGNDGGTVVSGHRSGNQQWWLGFRLRFQEGSAERDNDEDGRRNT